MAAALRATSGVAAISGADALYRDRIDKDKWPYVWAAAPPGSEHVFKIGTIISPGDNNQHEILAYQIPNNRRFVFRGLVLAYSNPGAVWTPGDGNVTFALTVNKGAGLTPAMGIPFKDYGSVQIPLGSFTQGPWPIDPGELTVIDSRNILRALLTINSAVIPPGPPTSTGFFTAIFVGWNIPE